MCHWTIPPTSLDNKIKAVQPCLCDLMLSEAEVNHSVCLQLAAELPWKTRGTWTPEANSSGFILQGTEMSKITQTLIQEKKSHLRKETWTLSDTLGKYFHFKIRIYPLGNRNICAKAVESFRIRQILSLKESKNRIRITNRLPSESKERSVQHTQCTRLMCERRKCLLFKFLLLSFRQSLKTLKVLCLI